MRKQKKSSPSASISAESKEIEILENLHSQTLNFLALFTQTKLKPKIALAKRKEFIHRLEQQKSLIFNPIIFKTLFFSNKNAYLDALTKQFTLQLMTICYIDDPKEAAATLLQTATIYLELLKTPPAASRRGMINAFVNIKNLIYFINLQQYYSDKNSIISTVMCDLADKLIISYNQHAQGHSFANFSANEFELISKDDKEKLHLVSLPFSTFWVYSPILDNKEVEKHKWLIDQFRTSLEPLSSSNSILALLNQKLAEIEESNARKITKLLINLELAQCHLQQKEFEKCKQLLDYSLNIADQLKAKIISSSSKKVYTLDKVRITILELILLTRRAQYFQHAGFLAQDMTLINLSIQQSQKAVQFGNSQLDDIEEFFTEVKKEYNNQLPPPSVYKAYELSIVLRQLIYSAQFLLPFMIERMDFHRSALLTTPKPPRLAEAILKQSQSTTSLPPPIAAAATAPESPQPTTSSAASATTSLAPAAQPAPDFKEIKLHAGDDLQSIQIDSAEKNPFVAFETNPSQDQQKIIKAKIKKIYREKAQSSTKKRKQDNQQIRVINSSEYITQAFAAQNRTQQLNLDLSTCYMQLQEWGKAINILQPNILLLEKRSKALTQYAAEITLQTPDKLDKDLYIIHIEQQQSYLIVLIRLALCQQQQCYQNAASLSVAALQQSLTTVSEAMKKVQAELTNQSQRIYSEMSYIKGEEKMKSTAIGIAKSAATQFSRWVSFVQESWGSNSQQHDAYSQQLIKEKEAKQAASKTATDQKASESDEQKYKSKSKSGKKKQQVKQDNDGDSKDKKDKSSAAPQQKSPAEQAEIEKTEIEKIAREIGDVLDVKKKSGQSNSASKKSSQEKAQQKRKKAQAAKKPLGLQAKKSNQPITQPTGPQSNLSGQSQSLLPQSAPASAPEDDEAVLDEKEKNLPALVLDESAVAAASDKSELIEAKAAAAPVSAHPVVQQTVTPDKKEPARKSDKIPAASSAHKRPSTRNRKKALAAAALAEAKATKKPLSDTTPAISQNPIAATEVGVDSKTDQPSPMPTQDPAAPAQPILPSSIPAEDHSPSLQISSPRPDLSGDAITSSTSSLPKTDPSTSNLSQLSSAHSLGQSSSSDPIESKKHIFVAPPGEWVVLEGIPIHDPSAIFPPLIIDLINDINSFCAREGIAGVTPKGGVLRCYLRGIFQPKAKFAPSDYDFELNNPTDLDKQIRLDHFLKTINAVQGKRDSLHTVLCFDEKEKKYLTADIDINYQDSNSLTDLLANSLKIQLQYTAGKVSSFTVLFHTGYFKDSAAVRKHFADGVLETPIDPEQRFAGPGYLCMLRNTRFSIRENWKLDKVKAAMKKQAPLLNYNNSDIIKHRHTLFSCITNELEKLVNLSHKQQLQILQLYDELGWLSQLFPLHKSSKRPIEHGLIYATLTSHPHISISLLYQLHYLGCWINKKKDYYGNSKLEIVNVDYFQSKPHYALNLMKLAYQHGLALPRNFNSILQRCSHIIFNEPASQRHSWEIIKEDLRFLLLNDNALDQFYKIYQSGLLAKLFPGAAQQIYCDPIYSQYIQQQLAIIDKTPPQHRSLELILYPLLIGELLVSGLDLGELNKPGQSTQEITSYLAPIHGERYAYLFRKMRSVDLGRILGTAYNLEQQAAFAQQQQAGPAAQREHESSVYSDSAPSAVKHKQKAVRLSGDIPQSSVLVSQPGDRKIAAVILTPATVAATAPHASHSAPKSQHGSPSAPAGRPGSRPLSVTAPPFIPSRVSFLAGLSADVRTKPSLPGQPDGKQAAGQIKASVSSPPAAPPTRDLQARPFTPGFDFTPTEGGVAPVTVPAVSNNDGAGVEVDEVAVIKQGLQG